MTLEWVVAAVVAAWIGLFALIYPLADTRIEVAHGQMILRWRVLRYLPFGRRRIPLQRVVDVRPYTWRDWRLFVEVFGGSLRPGRRHVAIVVRSRWLGITYGIIVAPIADDLVGTLKAAIAGSHSCSSGCG